MESQHIKFTLEEDPLKTVERDNSCHKLSLTATDCVTVSDSVEFGGRNISIATLLFRRRLQLSCTTKLTGNIYLLCSIFLPRHSREALNGIPLNIEQGISKSEMLHGYEELTRALLG